MNFEQLKEKMDKSKQDFLRNEEPYKSFIEERSGFDSGVDWTLKKLNKLGLLKLDKEE